MDHVHFGILVANCYVSLLLLRGTSGVNWVVEAWRRNEGVTCILSSICASPLNSSNSQKRKMGSK